MLNCIPSILAKDKSDKAIGQKFNQELVVTAIKNVNIISMAENKEVIPNATLVIKGNKIESINGVIPEGANIIDGANKWIIPGLIDMHVHGLSNSSLGKQYATAGANFVFDTQDVMTPYVANGVTTIFELSERVGLIAQRDEIETGKVLGPRMALTGFIDGGESYLGASHTAEQARQAVRLAKNRGYRFLKLYSSLSREAFLAAIAEAKEQDLKVVGHIPRGFKGDTEDAFVPGFLIAHAEELSSQTDDYSYEKALEYARLAKANGVWLIPNMSNLSWIIKQAESLDAVRNLDTLKYVHPLIQDKWLTANSYAPRTKLVPLFKKQLEFHKLLVRAFKAESVPMVTGTDAGTSGIVTGFSLHDELALLVDAGLTNKEALLSATRLAATWLEIEDKVGTIEPGKLADLLLLDSNPLEDIKRSKNIAGVFVNGRWTDKVTIELMLEELATKNSQNLGKPEFSWEKIIKKLRGD